MSVETITPNVADTDTPDPVLPLTPEEQREVLEHLRYLRGFAEQAVEFVSDIPSQVDNLPPMARMLFGGLLK